MSAVAARARFAEERHPRWLIGGATLAWFALYHFLLPFWDHLLYGAFALPRSPHWADALHFFLYDSTKILLLLVGIIFAVRILRSFLSIERTRALLGGKREGIGNVAAAGLGVATPFCSCSAVPAFIGFVAAGVPLGVTLTLPDREPDGERDCGRSPVRPVRLQDHRPVHRLRPRHRNRRRSRPRPDALERYIEPFVLDAAGNVGAAGVAEYRPTWAERIELGVAEVKTIVGKVWIYVLAGIALGAAIHGWVPADFFARVAGSHNPFAVPFAVLLGIPLYSNAAGVLPLVEALHAKGVAMGTVLAFMMAVVALSLPEMILLRRVLRPQLLGIYVGVVAVGIVATGYLFNAIL